MDFKVEKNNKQIRVNVSVSSDTTTKQAVDTPKVIEYLKINKIKVGECLKESYVCNRNGVFSGEWLFTTTITKKVLDKPIASVLSSSKVRKNKKVSKTIDE